MSDIKGLVLDGGAHRAAFCAGALDFLTDTGVEFDYIVSVAESSFSALCHLCGKKSRPALQLEGSDDALWKRILRGDWLRYLADFIRPAAPKELKELFDFTSYSASAAEHELVASDRDLGKPVYLTEKKDADRLMKICGASCSTPVFYQPVEIDGRSCYDGAVCDPLPIERAEQKGCDKVLIILSNPASSYESISSKKRAFYGFVFRNSPAFLEALCTQPERRSASLSHARELEKSGRAFIVAPVASTDSSSLEALYREGYETMQKSYGDFRKFIG